MTRDGFQSFVFSAFVVFSIMTISSCGKDAATSSDGTGSEIATSSVSGTLQGGGSSTVAYSVPKEKVSSWANLLRPGLWELTPEAFAATWSCTGNGFSGSYSSTPGNYVYTPRSCTVSYRNGKSSSAVWSTTWAYNYGTSCTGTGFNPDTQPANCAITRTSPTGGNARTVTGPNGNAYTVTHDTTVANTGYNSSAVPTTAAGVVLTCTAANCATRTLVINGSHLTGTLTPSGGTAAVFWDHTVSTTSTGLSITGTGTSRVVTGNVVVQHNRAKFTSTSTLSAVTYGDSTCCFPTSGTLTTSFSGGPTDGKSETLTFSTACGEATLTDTNGVNTAYTLTHCI